jgi:hypothetical protein
MESMWFALATITTNGYSDKVPASWKGHGKPLTFSVLVKIGMK